MSSKIFKSSYMSDSSRLEIEASIASTSFHITHCTVVSEKSFMFDNTTAPALALAILEAAGYSEESHGLMEYVVGNLREAVRYEAERTAEAKEQAELEAEALDLFNTLQTEIHGNLGPNWVHVTEFPSGETKRKWLAVARKAREMAKESTK